MSITAGNRHDITELYSLIKDRKVDYKGTILVDKGYRSKVLHEKILNDFDIKIDVANRGKRWVVERTHAWFNNFRKLKVRYEKTTASFMALHCIVASLMAFKRVIIIYG